MQVVRDWFTRTFADRQVAILALVLAAAAAGFSLFASILAPLIAAIVCAYLLEGLVNAIERLRVHRTIAVWIVFLVFVELLLFASLFLFPLLFRQLTQLLQQMPSMLGEAQRALMQLPALYPEFVSGAEIDQIMTALRGELLLLGQRLLSQSLSSLVNLATLVVYLVLVPFLVFYLLKDKDRIIAWAVSFLPPERHLTARVWAEVNEQLANYVRGKLLEVMIVGIVSYLAFAALGMGYAALLAVLSGVSVVLPYVGTILAMVPVAVVGYFQWGIAPPYAYALAAYTVIHVLDGYALNPWLMSEAVKIHPVAIVAAILFFGGLWGFWGVFFAIPIASVIHAVLRAWPRATRGPALVPARNDDAGAGHSAA